MFDKKTNNTGVKNRVTLLVTVAIMCVCFLATATFALFTFSQHEKTEFTVGIVELNTNIVLDTELDTVLPNQQIGTIVDMSKKDDAIDCYIRVQLKYVSSNTLTTEEQNYLDTINAMGIYTNMISGYQWSSNINGCYYLLDNTGALLKVTNTTEFSLLTADGIRYPDINELLVSNIDNEIGGLDLVVSVQAIQANNLDGESFDDIKGYFETNFLDNKKSINRVAFNSNYGTKVSAVNVNAGATITEPTTTRVGYTFAGWYLDPAFVYPVNFATPIYYDTTMYAKWTCTTLYDANGGCGNMVDNNSPYVTGETVTVLPNTFIAPGDNVFVNWNTQSNGAGDTFEPGDTFVITGSTTLYAMWGNSVTYDSNGGSGTMTDEYSPYITGATVTVLASTFSPPTDSVFVKWNTINDGSGTDYFADDTFVIDSNTTLYAIWGHNVIYNSNGGIGVMIDPSSPYISGSTVTVLASKFIAPVGKVFVRWDTSATGNGTAYDAGDTFVINSGLTLYAIWGYSITYMANGGNGATVDTSSPYMAGSFVSIIFNTFIAPDGYVFYKWNTASDKSGTYYTPGDTIALNNNLVLYAIWGYMVEYDANGGTGTMTDLAGPYLTGSTVTVLASTFTSPNANQGAISWNTMANGGGTTYYAGDTFTITSNVILYAQWDKVYVKHLYPNEIYNSTLYGQVSTFYAKDATDISVLSLLVNDYSVKFSSKIIEVENNITTISHVAIGTGSTDYFDGTFNGEDYEINIAVNNPTSDYQGLFGYVGANGLIINLVVSGSVSGNSYVGGIVGCNMGSIESCINNATVTGATSCAGGICGSSSLDITDCVNNATVTGSGYVGGITGAKLTGDLTYCTNNGDVTGVQRVAGIMADGSGVANCVNNGDITATHASSYVAGIASSGYATDCNNTGTITGNAHVAGIVSMGAGVPLIV